LAEIHSFNANMKKRTAIREASKKASKKNSQNQHIKSDAPAVHNNGQSLPVLQKEQLPLHSKGEIVSATYQKGVTSLDTKMSAHERADMYSLRAASKPSACHGPPSATAQLTAHWTTTSLPDYSPRPHGAAVWRIPHRADALRFPLQSSVTSQ
jgi:hypothetical protein